MICFHGFYGSPDVVDVVFAALPERAEEEEEEEEEDGCLLATLLQPRLSCRQIQSHFSCGATS